jgi:hypothetical protein
MKITYDPQADAMYIYTNVRDRAPQLASRGRTRWPIAFDNECATPAPGCARLSSREQKCSRIAFDNGQAPDIVTGDPAAGLPPARGMRDGGAGLRTVV